MNLRILKLMCILWTIAFFRSADAQCYIVRDSVISRLVSRYNEYTARAETTDGYRLQITYTDVRDEVYKSKANLYRIFPELRSYVDYDAPYYKLKVGDFATRLEATYYLQQIITHYPGAFIVKDKIKIQ
ncbi:MAG: hypothetical protein NZM35_02300 [Chitinophagales bacterium]|nr:hypothetical protein [Chitinophagales bacterium]MDW8418267.1 hypothetical protein [Chitinophagales bacterium]